ncbi:MAG: hypothetical protein MR019_02740 [Ruminococcus sp.]|nr:hypothetical protein [Ruminococcus sp.]MDY3895198.1 hypothetical protein [Candidatus Fimenecus sp.]
MTKLRLSPPHSVPPCCRRGIYDKITSRNYNKIKDFDRFGEHWRLNCGFRRCTPCRPCCRRGIYDKITSQNDNKIKDFDRFGEH